MEMFPGLVWVVVVVVVGCWFVILRQTVTYCNSWIVIVRKTGAHGNSLLYLWERARDGAPCYNVFHDLRG